MKPFLPQWIAYTCTFISIFGILFLLVLAILFQHNAETLISDLPENLSGAQVAHTCFLAAFIYTRSVMATSATHSNFPINSIVDPLSFYL
ncbi:hypothetical protein PCANB_001096 [Pneumocystis canis]|nr:hypothetical protein PCK1_001045 [Pneumocystis canis]KAG5437303.1 hypothetical protein PCANB_001096 [Pneumocystis canis]